MDIQLTNRLVSSFVWYYCDKYLDLLDPYGYYGKKVFRLIKTDMKLRGLKFREVLIDFLVNLEEYDKHYDCVIDVEGDYHH